MKIATIAKVVILLRTTYALPAVAALAVMAGIWFGTKVIAEPKIINVVLDPPGPISTPSIIPTTFREAGRMACDEYIVDYKLWLVIRLLEMGRRNMEMGIQGRNAAIEKRHPYFSQAYWAAYLIALNQKRFAMDKGTQEKWYSMKYPFIAFLCYKWSPIKSGKNNWREYYWSGNHGGIAGIYDTYSVGDLERMVDKKTEERFGKTW